MHHFHSFSCDSISGLSRLHIAEQEIFSSTVYTFPKKIYHTHTYSGGPHVAIFAIHHRREKNKRRNNSLPNIQILFLISVLKLREEYIYISEWRWILKTAGHHHSIFKLGHTLVEDEQYQSPDTGFEQAQTYILKIRLKSVLQVPEYRTYPNNSIQFFIFKSIIHPRKAPAPFKQCGAKPPQP